MNANKLLLSIILCVMVSCNDDERFITENLEETPIIETDLTIQEMTSLEVLANKKSKLSKNDAVNKTESEFNSVDGCWYLLGVFNCRDAYAINSSQKTFDKVNIDYEQSDVLTLQSYSDFICDYKSYNTIEKNVNLTNINPIALRTIFFLWTV